MSRKLIGRDSRRSTRGIRGDSLQSDQVSAHQRHARRSRRRPCIAETRISVMDIVNLERMGKKPEEMRTWFSSRPLTLAEVYAALTYYYDHKDEVDACFEEDQKWDSEHDERRAEYMKQKAAGFLE